MIDPQTSTLVKAIGAIKSVVEEAGPWRHGRSRHGSLGRGRHDHFPTSANPSRTAAN
jgi:hypothetical protein